MSTMSVVHVAVAVIVNQNDEILIAKRGSHQHQGNKWEFPGGKVEDNETSQEALRREIFEELGVQIESATQITNITHDYADKKVILDVYLVENWQGEIEGKENQPILWVDKKSLNQYEFPAANEAILKIIAV